MELMDAIKARRSVRAYKPDPVAKEMIERLLDAAVLAPTGMNAQPWAFGVIQDAAKLREYDERTKAFLLSKVDEWAWLAPYAEHFASPGYSVLYGAPALVVIYAKDSTPLASMDCTLAAENLMLAACDMGLGTCWIGFSAFILNSPETKRELGVPDDYVAVAPIIVGYPAGPVPMPERNPPEIVYWK